MTRSELSDASGNKDMLFLDEEEYDYALVGYIENSEGNPVALYDIQKVVETMVMFFGMEYEDAWEYYDYNIASGWVGEHTPMFANIGIDID